jgi:hypothetical protein
MELANYPVNELQDLKSCLEEQMKKSVDDAFSLQKWHDRVSEAIEEATGQLYLNNEDFYEDRDGDYYGY